MSLPYKETKKHAKRAEHQTPAGSERSLLLSSFLKKKPHRISEAERRELKHSGSCRELTAIKLLQGE